MTASEKRSKLRVSCGRARLVLRSVKDGVSSVASMTMRCSSWLCPICAKKKVRRFTAATAAFFGTDRISILTLTMDRSQNLHDSFASINPAWNRLRTLLSQRLGRFKFVRVLEAQPASGYPHLHVLVSAFVPRAWLVKHVAACGFGKIFDIREVHGRNAFFYVRKYLAKSWSSEEALDACVALGLRRISGSRGFRISSRSAVPWEVLGIVKSDSGFLRFSRWVALNFQNHLWELVGILVADDWVSMDWGLVSGSLPACFDSFALVPDGVDLLLDD